MGSLFKGRPLTLNDADGMAGLNFRSHRKSLLVRCACVTTVKPSGHGYGGIDVVSLGRARELLPCKTSVNAETGWLGCDGRGEA